jgi:hypothetical protein
MAAKGGCRSGRLCRLVAGLAVVVMAGAVAARADKETAEQMRIRLIRGLSSEIAVAKVALPRGKRGLLIDPDGKINQDEANREMKENGPAINPGMPVVITKLTFKPKAMVFEINGGGKGRKKWYQHIEVGVGNTTQPIAPQPPVVVYGSWVTLKFSEKLPAQLTVEKVKQMLESALDFTRHSPTELYSPQVPEKFKEAIKQHQVLVGMSRDVVLSAKGPPDRKVREDDPNGNEKEDWIYGLPPHVLYVTFDGDTVVSVHQY